MEVQIDEGYQLGFFPGLSIDGKGLSIAGSDGETAFVASKNFRVAIQLMPLLKQQVKISSVELTDGSVDLNEFPEKAPAEIRSSRGKGALPQVDSLLVVDFNIHLANSETVIGLKRLYLTEFRAGRETPIELEIGIVGAAESTTSFVLEGVLTVEEGQPSANLEIEDLSIESGSFSIANLSGALRWVSEPGKLEGQLSWKTDLREASVDLGIELGEILSGTIKGEYQDAAITGSVQTEFSLDAPRKYSRVESIRLELAGQVVHGDGCILWSGDPAVALMLKSDELDLDKLKTMVPESEDASAKLPLDLAISLAIGRARLNGVEAVDAKVVVGKEPACP